MFIDLYDKITISFQAFTLTTTPVLRDPSAWYHIMFVADTTQATEGNRFKIYLNGTQLTLGSSGTFIAQNTDLAFNQAGIHQISGRNEGNRYFDGYMAELHLIDGTALGQRVLEQQTNTERGLLKNLQAPTVLMDSI